MRPLPPGGCRRPVDISLLLFRSTPKRPADTKPVPVLTQRSERSQVYDQAFAVHQIDFSLFFSRFFIR
ncbi:hypothetical protein GE061_009638 [Apolygus lucorum]|uniref:Uncharacterized protein n=1 Tax=Apolygus lucorum TaxID=248454 RepID=A0A8S9Y137_APOLU|nr:hypothetical protein GE061_009638 [Apolygus lucorum]